MGIDIDFGVVKDYVPTAPGEYTCIIDDCELKKAQKDDSKYVLHVQLKITEHDQFDGRKLKDWIYIDPENPFGLQSFVQSIMQSEEVGNFTLDDDWCSQVVGEQVTVVVRSNGATEDGRPLVKVAAYTHPK